LQDNVLLLIAVFFAGGWLFCRLSVKAVMNMIIEAGFVRPNYRGDAIPVGVGLVFFLSALAVYAVAFIFLPGVIQGKVIGVLLALACFTLLGLIDDTWGSRSVTGLKGHLLSLFQGRLTTGGLKAAGGGVVALLLAASAGSWTMIPLNALIIALSVNGINLVDLRPGRAGKVFILSWLVLLSVTSGKMEMILPAVVAGALLAYLPYDLKARAMMGDTGSNALGASLGMAAVWLLETPYKAGYLAFLIVFHIFTEKYSLTKIIAGNRLLDYLDKLGRR
jgi:UDP-N-acetylmuramyl pentapeptide phosphotransferase/UDP-N-acetylglucosamine-1-phosphate transferase